MMDFGARGIVLPPCEGPKVQGPKKNRQKNEIDKKIIKIKTHKK